MRFLLFSFFMCTYTITSNNKVAPAQTASSSTTNHQSKNNSHNAKLVAEHTKAKRAGIEHKGKK